MDEYTVVTCVFNLEEDSRQKLLRDQFFNRYAFLNSNRPYPNAYYNGNEKYWLKPQLINNVARWVNSKYILWIDPDILFTNSKWIESALSVIENNPDKLVHLWQYAFDLDESDNPVLGIETSIGFGNSTQPDKVGKPWPDGLHCGYAWGCLTKAFIESTGLFEPAIVGGDDYLMAMSALGKVEMALSGLESSAYRDCVFQWSERFNKVFKGLTYVNGSIFHYWHGAKSSREYDTRSRLLDKFNPYTDLVKTGVYHVAHLTYKVDEIAAYMQRRKQAGERPNDIQVSF
jgi:hypothetical protein